ncbi:MAG TPA: zinc ribbon domain-containing protein [Vicinamibacteria bacterium]
MPIYEYACPGCGARFEKLVRRFGDAVSCPTCASGDVEKQLSVFAVATAAPPSFAGCGAGACGPGAVPCEAGPCGAGACALN